MVRATVWMQVLQVGRGQCTITAVCICRVRSAQERRPSQGGGVMAGSGDKVVLGRQA